MAQTQLKVRIVIAWWLKPYLYGVIMTAWLMRAKPDPVKVEHWVRRAIKLKVDRG